MSEEQSLKKRAAIVRAYRTTFSSRSGKIVLKDLIEMHYMLITSFVPGDPYATTLNEGERNVVIRVLQQINMNPNDFLKQIEEIVEGDDTDAPNELI